VVAATVRRGGGRERSFPQPGVARDGLRYAYAGTHLSFGPNRHMFQNDRHVAIPVVVVARTVTATASIGLLGCKGADRINMRSKRSSFLIRHHRKSPRAADTIQKCPQLVTGKHAVLALLIPTALHYWDYRLYWAVDAALTSYGLY
jgi:hypothetical protein